MAMTWAEASKQDALKAQAALLTADCTAKQKVAKETNDFYQKTIGVVNARLKRSSMLSSKCVAISSDPTQLSAGGYEHAGQNGLSTQWLHEYAAEAEEYRTQRIACDMHFKATNPDD